MKCPDTSLDTKKKRSYAQVTGGGVTLTILKLLNDGMYAKQIADKLKKSKTTIHRHIEKLIKMGLLVEELRTFSKIYIVSDKGKTAINKEKLPRFSCISTIRLGTHLRVYIPIIKKGRMHESFWDNINDRFRNSVIKHKNLSAYIEGASVRETSKGIELNIKHRRISALKDIIPLVTNSVFWAIGFFSNHGYELDHLNYFVNDTHNTIWTEDTEEIAEELGRVTVRFPHERAKITSRDPAQPSKAWLDRTPEPNLETNDIDYAESFIRMPVAIRNLENMIRGFVPQQTAISNAINYSAVSIKSITEFLGKVTAIEEKILELLGKSPRAPLAPSDEDIMVKVQFLKDHGAFTGILRGNIVPYEPKRVGQTLYVSKLTAKALLNNQIAKLINSDDNK